MWAMQLNPRRQGSAFEAACSPHHLCYCPAAQALLLSVRTPEVHHVVGPGELSGLGCRPPGRLPVWCVRAGAIARLLTVAQLCRNAVWVARLVDLAPSATIRAPRAYHTTPRAAEFPEHTILQTVATEPLHTVNLPKGMGVVASIFLLWPRGWPF